MALETSEILLKLVEGGLIGYITNFLAVNIFFKKYPIIGGNTISKNSDFIKANLVNSISGNLNSHEIENYFNDNHTLKKELKKSVDEIFDYSLYNNIPDIKLAELPGFTEFENNIKNNLKQIDITENLDIDELLKLIDIEKILGSEQLKIFSNKAYNLIMQNINSDLKSFFSDIYDDFKQNNIKDLFFEKNLEEISNKIKLMFDDIKPKLLEIDSDIDKMLLELLNVIDINGVFEELEKSIKNKKIIDIIGLENKDKITTELIEHFITFIDTEEGKQLINNLSTSLINLTKDIKQSPLSFLNPVLQVKMFNFIRTNLPFLSENAKEWIRINKVEIEELIENTIEEYYANKQGIMNQLKLKVKDIIGLKITEYFQIVEKGIEKLEKYIQESATRDLTEGIVDFLDSREIGDIFSQLNINSEKLSDFFYKAAHRYLPKLNTSLFDSLFDKKLSDTSKIFKVNVSEKFGEQINNFLVRQIKYQIFYNDKFLSSLKEALDEKIEAFKNSKVELLLSKEKFEGYTGYLPIFLMFSQSKIVEKLMEEIKRQLSNQNLNSILTVNLKNSIRHGISDLYNKNNTFIINRIKDTKIKSLYNHLFNNERKEKSEILGENIFNNSKRYLISSLTSPLESNIKQISNEKLNNIMSNFWGNKLQTLYWQGAGLGAFTNIAFYISGITSFSSTTLNFATTIISYSTIGVATNYLSLNKLIKTENSSVLDTRKLVLTNQLSSELADDFIATHSINENFDDDLIVEIKKTLTQNDYDIFNQITALEVNNNFPKNIVKTSLELLSENRENIIKSIINKIDNYDLKEIELKTFYSFFSNIINGTKTFLGNFLNSKIESYRQQNLDQVIPEKIKVEINNFISTKTNNITSEFIDTIEHFQLEKKLEEIISQLENYLNFDVKLASFFSNDKTDDLIIKTNNYLKSIIKNKIGEAIQKYIHKIFIEDEFASHREINSLFKGELVGFAKNNVGTVIEKILFELGFEKLKNEKENISEKIIEKVRESNKDSILYGLGESLLNIDTDIKEIIHLLIDEKIEPYLKTKEWELETILTGFIDFLGKKKLGEIGLTEDVLNSENILSLINRFLENDNIEKIIEYFCNALTNDILNQNLSFILGLTGINSLKDIPSKFKDDTEKSKNTILNNFKSNKVNISDNISGFSKILVNKLIYQIELKDIFANISKEDIEQITKNIINRLYSSESFIKYKNKFSEKIYNSIIEKKAGEIVDIILLEKDLNNLADEFINNENYTNQIEFYLKPFIEKLSKTEIPDISKDFLIEIVSKCIDNSLKKNYSGLINSINIKELLVKDINNFSHEQIRKISIDATDKIITKSLWSGVLGGFISLVEIILILNK